MPAMFGFRDCAALQPFLPLRVQAKGGSQSSGRLLLSPAATAAPPPAPAPARALLHGKELPQGRFTNVPWSLRRSRAAVLAVEPPVLQKCKFCNLAMGV